MATLYVKEQGTTLRKEQERLVVTKGAERLLDLPVIKVDRVVIMGRGVQVTTATVFFLAQRGVPLIYTSQNGAFRAESSAGLGNNGELRLAQGRMVDNPALALPIIRSIVAGKLSNQARLLHSRRRLWGAEGERAIGLIERLARDANGAADADQAQGIEGAGAAAYWGAWAGVFANGWGFSGRKYYPPPDPLNALLSFGYTLLLKEVLTGVRAISLDPYLGFFHTVQYGRPSVALDIEEEFRPLLVDDLVLRLLEARTIGPRNFGPATDQATAVHLDDAGRERFLLAFEERLQQRVRYTLGAAPTSETWQRTIQLQVEQMARAIMGVQPYRPMPWPEPAQS